MPPNLTRVTVDLEGTVRNCETKRKLNLVPTRDPINVKVDLRETKSLDGYFARLHGAVNRLGGDWPAKAVAYSVSAVGKGSYKSGSVWFAVQFYRRENK